MAAPVDPGRAPLSVRRGALARLVGEATWALLSLATGAVVARQLGPDGKGSASSLSYLIALVGPLAALGLGEAGVALVRRGRVTLDHAVAATVPVLVVSSAIGAAVFAAMAILQFGHLARQLDGSILAGMATIPFVAAWQSLSLLAEADGRFVATNAARVALGLVTSVATAVLVLKLHRGVAGAIAAGGLGFAVAATMVAVVLHRAGALPRARRDGTYVRDAVRIGVPIQLSVALVGLTGRADLLVVQWNRGGAQAGLYSVALTMSQLVAYAPIALSSGSFPVVAGLPDHEVAPFVERLVRSATAVALGTVGLVLLILPWGLPLAFGPGFRAALPLAFWLLPSGVLYGQQWVLCRGWAARGRGHVQLHSFVASTAVMLAGDFVLVPLHGAVGAAAASFLASVVGVAVAVRSHRRLATAPVLVRRLLVPGWHDVERMLAGPARLLARRRSPG